jgi:hypothetical protein
MAKGVEAVSFYGSIRCSPSLSDPRCDVSIQTRKVDWVLDTNTWAESIGQMLTVFPHLSTMHVQWDFTTFIAGRRWEQITGAILGSRLECLRIRLFLQEQQVVEWGRFVQVFRELEQSTIPTLELQPWYDEETFNGVLDLLWPWRSSELPAHTRTAEVDVAESIWPTFDNSLCVTLRSEPSKQTGTRAFRQRTLVAWCGESVDGSGERLATRWNKPETAQGILRKTRDALAVACLSVKISAAAKQCLNDLNFEWPCLD